MNKYQTTLGTASLTIHCESAEEAAQLALENFGCKLEPKQFKLVAPSNKSHINISLNQPSPTNQSHLNVTNNPHQEVVKAVAQGVTMPASIAKTPSQPLTPPITPQG